MTNSDIREYFAQLASSHQLIQHSENSKRFFRMDLEEIFNSKLSLDSFFVVLERNDTRYNAPNYDTISKQRNVGFLILKGLTVSNRNDKEAHDEVFEAAEEIADDFVSKLVKDIDSASDNIIDQAPTPFPFFKSVDVNTIRMLQVGPVLDACFGVRVEVSFESSNYVDFKEDRWV